jgi:hypothetical protein
VKTAGACAWLLLVLAGCDPGEELGKVSGRVTFQGEPISEGLIIFSNEELGVFMSAEIGSDGTYEVEMAKGYGLPLGTYHVAITPPLIEHPPGPIDSPPDEQAFPEIPSKYHFPENSGLTFRVKSGENEFSPDMQP